MLQKLTYKVLLLGDPSVGKTSILRRLVFNRFEHNYKATLGVDFLTYKVETRDSESMLTIWDVCGTARWATFLDRIFVGTRIAIIVFDLTREETLLNVNNWIFTLLTRVSKWNPPQIVIVGNKNDLSDKRFNDSLDIHEHVKNDFSFYETSAKTGANIKKLFIETTQQLRDG